MGQNHNGNKIELLAPAGNLEKLKIAALYGADAVYFGGEKFGLRSASDNFALEEIKYGLDFLHSHNKKGYITANIIPHNEDIDEFSEFLEQIYNAGADGIIVADIGMIDLIRNSFPNLNIHVSTQANNVNYKTVQFYEKLGAKRIVLARELSLEEISRIKSETNIELEVFVHGAMCMAYSGRCFLSKYMIDRDANMGECAHPCRWKYHIVEETRPHEIMPVIQGSGGTFIFNSKDLCMIEHIPELIRTGVKSFKIEGRVKSSYYVATIVKVYREAIDKYLDNPDKYSCDERWLDELKKVSYRSYSTGFYLGKNLNNQVYDTSTYIRNYDFVGIVLECKDNIMTVEQRNKFKLSDELEIIEPFKEGFTNYRVETMYDEFNSLIESAPHAQMIVRLPTDKNISKSAILRKKTRG